MKYPDVAHVQATFSNHACPQFFNKLFFRILYDVKYKVVFVLNISICD